MNPVVRSKRTRRLAMADAKLVGSGGVAAQGNCGHGEAGGPGEHAERGRRGPRGHEGPQGPQGPQGPAADAVPTAAFAVSTTTIYARVTGSDTTGNGTLTNPYRTFQRAIRDVPLLPAPGARYIVDITGIGTEVFPPNYTTPAITVPTIGYPSDTSRRP